jgi:pyridoxamine 5'-phosphate oxidase
MSSDDLAETGLRESEVDPDPFRQFRSWFAQAEATGVPQPEAMTLATATPDGWPSARVVLLRGQDERGFVFFTNYLSRKGKELAANGRAALVFFWEALQRQVRVEGVVEVVTAEESDQYFRGRPRGHQLGAWTSYQSQVLAGRDVLEADLAELTARFADGEVPRPPHWGGFRVVPETIEFWQGRLNRLHDRLRYRRVSPGGWVVERLAP